MKISGFTFARNAGKYAYPVAEAIESILPVCDEFVVALGDCDADDDTRARIKALRDDKIRSVDTVWHDVETLRGRIYSQQTNIALAQCSGDWCFYIQCDEVMHERRLPQIRRRCEELLDDTTVEGLLFAYRHFWGDYDHYQNGHHWYPAEIRIVRNGIGVQSIGDAQSFRVGDRKLAVARVHAEMYHYGYVRPPRLMQKRNRNTETTYHGVTRAAAKFQGRSPAYDFGNLAKVPRFTGTHPAVMQPRIAAMDWKHELRYSGPRSSPENRERLKHRILTFIEQRFLGGRRIGGYRNYVLLRGK